MGKKTLVLDDNRDFLHSVADYLEASGFRVTAFESADDAMTELSEDQLREFDFVVTDLEMPGTKGDTFALLVYLINPNVKITVISGAIKNVSVPAARISTPVEKPFKLETLVIKMLESGVPNRKRIA